MSDHPLIFSAPMVRAILGGQKTQTRRVLRLPPDAHPPCDDDDGRDLLQMYRSRFPYPGDLLWVKEGHRFPVSGGVPSGPVYYEADKHWFMNQPFEPGPPRSPIHMPRWASRITLEVTGVRIERLQEISEADVDAEGVPHLLYDQGAPRSRRLDFETFWDSPHRPGARWADNPWVLVYEFRGLEKSDA